MSSRTTQMPPRSPSHNNVDEDEKAKATKAIVCGRTGREEQQEKEKEKKRWRPRSRFPSTR